MTTKILEFPLITPAWDWSDGALARGETRWHQTNYKHTDRERLEDNWGMAQLAQWCSGGRLLQQALRAMGLTSTTNGGLLGINRQSSTQGPQWVPGSPCLALPLGQQWPMPVHLLCCCPTSCPSEGTPACAATCSGGVACTPWPKWLATATGGRGQRPWLGHGWQRGLPAAGPCWLEATPLACVPTTGATTGPTGAGWPQ